MASMPRLVINSDTTTADLESLILSLMNVFCLVITILLKLTSLKLLSTRTVKILEPPDPPDPPDSSRYGSVPLHCHGLVLCNGTVSKSQSRSPPPRYVVEIFAGKEIKMSMSFKHQCLCANSIGLLGMVTLVTSMFSEKVILVYSDVTERLSTTISTDELQFSWFSNLATLAYSCDKERFSTTLSTDELQFSWFSNLAILQLWLSSEFSNLSAIILNTFTSYLSPLYVLVYIPRVLSIYLEWCCHQRTSFRLVKVFLIPKSRNPSSFMDRGSLSSATRIFMFLRAIYLGLKKAYFKTVACQISIIQKPVDWDFIVSILEGGLALRKASDRALSFVNLFSNDRCFGSLLISKDSTSLLCMIFDSIMLLYFWFFSFNFVELFKSILVWDWNVVTTS